jgi:hypothetical protein
MQLAAGWIVFQRSNFYGWRRRAFERVGARNVAGRSNPNGDRQPGNDAIERIEFHNYCFRNRKIGVRESIIRPRRLQGLLKIFTRPDSRMN